MGVVLLTHDYRQHGDAMRVRDVVFYRDDGRWFPARFWQDGFRGRQYDALVFRDGALAEWYPRRYNWLRDFAQTWLANLREQHGIE